MNDYTARDRSNYGEQDITKTALPKFIEKLEVCRSLFHGFDYSAFSEGSDYNRARTIAGGANFFSDICREKDKQSFIKEALLLRQALSLCRSLVGEDKRLEAAYFEAVRTLLTCVSEENKKL